MLTPESWLPWATLAFLLIMPTGMGLWMWSLMRSEAEEQAKRADQGQG
jgi:hypothetical protein